MIQLRLGNASTVELMARLRSGISAVHDFRSDPEESLLIIDHVFPVQEE